MSNEKQPALNLYAVYNQELERMHDLFRYYLSLPKEDQFQNQYHSMGSKRPTVNPHDIGMLYRRILDMQQLLMEALKTHEPMIQEKVAELALTGDSSEP